MSKKTTNPNIKAELKAVRNAGKPQRNYENLLIKAGVYVLAVGTMYYGFYNLLITLCRSDIRELYFKVAAVVFTGLLVIALAKKS